MNPIQPPLFECLTIDPLSFFQFVIPRMTANLQDDIQLSDLSFEVTGKRSQSGELKLIGVNFGSVGMIAIPIDFMAYDGENLLHSIFQSININLQRR